MIARLVVHALVLVAAFCGEGVARAGSAPLAYRYTLDYEAAPGGAAVVHATWTQLDHDGQPARAPRGGAQVRVCLMMPKCGEFVDRPVIDTGAGAAPVPMSVCRDDDTCFQARVAEGTPIAARYDVRLSSMAERIEDFDRATRVSGAIIATDKALLLRPEPTPDEGDSEITVHLPDGVGFAAPWPETGPVGDPPTPAGGTARTDRTVRTFRIDVRALDGGGYLAFGRLRALPEVPVRGGAFVPVLVDSEHKASDERLRDWLREGGSLVADFYQGLPAARMLVVLVPVAGSSDGGLFGTIFRRSGQPSAVLLFGAGASSAADFDNDWIPAHELFHVGNPDIEGRFPWFIEGFTTYYQDVLRGRHRPDRARVLWAELVAQFRLHCDGSGDGTKPLGVESAEMRRRGHFSRVYWGGACVAFQVDLAIRRRSRNKDSLDGVMRALLAESRQHDLDEKTVIERLDKAAGARVAQQALAGKKVPLDALWQQLGVVVAADGTVTLDDSAPLAAIRKAIF